MTTAALHTPHTPIEQQIKQASILVIDDAAFNRTLIKEILQNRGFKNAGRSSVGAPYCAARAPKSH